MRIEGRSAGLGADPVMHREVSLLSVKECRVGDCFVNGDSPSRLRKKGFRGDVRAAGMSAMPLSDALPGGLTACGGPLASGLVT